MKVIPLFLVVMLISACSGMPDYSASNIWGLLSPNSKTADKPHENAVNAGVPQPASAPPDYREAAARYRKAAETGDANAQYNLGMMYSKGQGVPQDFKEAVAWYRKAAEQGDAAAQNNLGDMYIKGQGVLPSHVVAYALYNLSAANDPSSTNIAASHRTYLTGKMPAHEIDAAQALTREMAKPNNLLSALDGYVRRPAVQEQVRQ